MVDTGSFIGAAGHGGNEQRGFTALPKTGVVKIDFQSQIEFREGLVNEVVYLQTCGQRRGDSALPG